MLEHPLLPAGSAPDDSVIPDFIVADRWKSSTGAREDVLDREVGTTVAVYVPAGVQP